MCELCAEIKPHSAWLLDLSQEDPDSWLSMVVSQVKADSLGESTTVYHEIGAKKPAHASIKVAAWSISICVKTSCETFGQCLDPIPQTDSRRWWPMVLRHGHHSHRAWGRASQQMSVKCCPWLPMVAPTFGRYEGFLSHGGTPIAGWLISGKIPSRVHLDIDDLGVPPLMETSIWKNNDQSVELGVLYVRQTHKWVDIGEW